MYRHFPRMRAEKIKANGQRGTKAERSELMEGVRKWGPSLSSS